MVSEREKPKVNINEQGKKLLLNFKRTLKRIKISSYYYLRCDFCDIYIVRNTPHVIDSRNDKYCPGCANKILDHQIDKLQSFKKSLCNESILNKLEEDNDEA